MDDITLDVVKQYLNITHTDDDEMLTLLLEVAKEYIIDYTGIDSNVIPKSLSLAVLQIVSSSFNNRDYVGETKLNVNRFVKSILDMHRRNFC